MKKQQRKKGALPIQVMIYANAAQCCGSFGRSITCRRPHTFMETDMSSAANVVRAVTAVEVRIGKSGAGKVEET